MVKKIVSVAFVVLIGLPLIVTVFNWSSFTDGELKEKPGLGEEGSRIPFPEVHLTPKFFVHMDAYVSENFPFRDVLVHMNALRDVKLLKSSFNNDVLVGKDGYLFLSETVSGSDLSEDELYGISSWLKKVEDRVVACGAKPLFIFIPDKRSIYEDKLPGRLEDEIYLNYEVAEARFDEEGIEFVALKEFLKEAYNVSEVYSKLDTHWNRYGAYLAFGRILEALNLKSLPQDDFQDYERYGDLSRMLGVGEKEVTYEPQVDLSGVNFSGKVVLYYDSFGLGLLPFFDQVFSKVESHHIMDVSPYDLERNCWGRADYVIIEIVERAITHLLNFTND
jgi:hypothetical protein